MKCVVCGAKVDGVRIPVIYICYECYEQLNPLPKVTAE